MECHLKRTSVKQTSLAELSDSNLNLELAGLSTHGPFRPKQGPQMANEGLSEVFWAFCEGKGSTTQFHELLLPCGLYLLGRRKPTAYCRASIITVFLVSCF